MFYPLANVLVFCRLDQGERSRLYMTNLRRQGFAPCIMLRLIEKWNKGNQQG
jgi:hypothetical protein